MIISENQYRFETLTVVKSSLITLYIALILPIPFLPFNQFRILSLILFIVGLVVISNLTNDYVTTNDINIAYETSKISSLLGKKRWVLHWKDIKQIKTLATSQGSKVYYFISKEENKILIPQRIEKFDMFIKIIEEKTDLETNKMRYLAPIWTYKILTIITTIMIFLEILSFVIRGYQY